MWRVNGKKWSNYINSRPLNYNNKARARVIDYMYVIITVRHGLNETTVVSSWVFRIFNPIQFYWVEFLKFKKLTGLSSKFKAKTQPNSTHVAVKPGGTVPLLPLTQKTTIMNRYAIHHSYTHYKASVSGVRPDSRTVVIILTFKKDTINCLYKLIILFFTA